MTNPISEEFVALLSPHFRLQDLEDGPVIVSGLWSDFTLAYLNPAWQKFAESNRGESLTASAWGVGANYLGAIAPPLRPFYENLLASAPDVGEAKHPVTHVYECSSATVFRQFRMQVYALRGRAGYVVIHSLMVESPHDLSGRPPHQADRRNYENEDGIVVQCSHCRLVRHGAEALRWDWVPDWVERSPTQTSHGLCPVCAEYYYPEMSQR